MSPKYTKDEHGTDFIVNSTAVTHVLILIEKADVCAHEAVGQVRRIPCSGKSWKRPVALHPEMLNP